MSLKRSIALMHKYRSQIIQKHSQRRLITWSSITRDCSGPTIFPPPKMLTISYQSFLTTPINPLQRASRTILLIPWFGPSRHPSLAKDHGNTYAPTLLTPLPATRDFSTVMFQSVLLDKLTY